MSHRRITRSHLQWIPVVVASLTVAAPALQAQEADWTPPLAADGKPDISGVWDFRTLTPLQRPEDQEATIDEARAAEIETAAVERARAADAPSDPEKRKLKAGDPVGGYNNFWFDRGARVVEDLRTSLIIDPPNGRLPDTLPGIKRQTRGDDKPIDRPVRLRVGGVGLDSYEDRGLSERCILGFNAGPPITPGGYNQNIQIFQSANHVAILNEMVHDTRIVPLDGRPHLPDSVRQWMGDSRGRWEGDTLIVETKNFSDLVSSFSGSVAGAVGDAYRMHVTERFRRVDEDTLMYEYTVNDPATFTRPFTARLLMKKGEALYEYACHEGNYGLFNILSGARAEEAEAVASGGGQ
ncbi:MAG: hypothetical protein F4Y16_00660 [Holophagales bacterium]|nr:hypothetical protein [Holophagales bacterium]MYH26461.1 hypothetical protein [Holophagales bacterium]MYH27228.1 hypothetical protein [Holophagales bacterium]